MITTKSFFSTVLLTIWAVTISSQALSAPKLEEYGLLPDVSQMTISPDGEHFAYRHTEVDKDVVLVYSIKKGVLVRGVDVSAIDPQEIYFNSNDTLILVVSQYKKLRNYRDALDISTAFTYSFKSGAIEPLIRAGEPLKRDSSIYAGQSGMGRIVGSSEDNKFVFMPAFVASSDVDGSPNYALLKVNSSGKGRPKIFSKGTDHVRDYFMDTKGNLIARESYHEKRKEHSLQTYVNKKWVDIYKEETALLLRSFVGLTSDAKSIIFLAYKDDFVSYYTMSLSDGNVAKLPFDKPNSNIEDVITDMNNITYGVRYSGFMPTYRFFDQTLQKRVEEIQEVFSGHSVWLEDWSENFKDILVKVEGSNYAGEYYLFTEGQKPQFVALERPNIKVEDLNLIGKTAYEARDGFKIPTLLTIPRNQVKNIKNLPAVIMPHGGPASYDRIGFDYMAQALASRGFLVIQPQFRGSSGFGYDHRSAGHSQWGKKMQDDLSDAVHAFGKKGMIDPKRVCIAGSSYGGYAALAGAAFTPDLYSCAFSLAGVSHLPKMIQADKRRYGKHSTVISYFKKTVGGGSLDKKVLKEISPYFFADKIKIPVMLAHGEDDSIVEYQQSRLMYSALKKAKADVEFVKLKNEDHYLQDQETRVQAVTAMVNFIEKHIGAEKPSP